LPSGVEVEIKAWWKFWQNKKSSKK
jgi:hypothetical protein